MKIDSKGADLRTCSERHDQELAELTARVEELEKQARALALDDSVLLAHVKSLAEKHDALIRCLRRGRMAPLVDLADEWAE